MKKSNQKGKAAEPACSDLVFNYIRRDDDVGKEGHDMFQKTMIAAIRHHWLDVSTCDVSRKGDP